MVERCQNPVGYVQDNTDCNDNLPSVYPNAIEICDGVDNNCDGVADDSSAVGQSTFYPDADGDGYGDSDSSTTIQQCQSIAAPGYVTNNFDCDDSTVDADGDGIADGYSINPETFWYLDADQDSYGNPNVFFQSCLAPMNYVSDNQDCNDLDADVKPNVPASAEICNGKVDRCENNIYGDLTAPDDERDDDGDMYVECEIDPSLLYNPDGTVNGWGSSETILGGLDCDPTTATTFPNNCPSEVDPTLCYQDSDQDGYGDEVVPVLSYPGQISAGTDCDDTNNNTSKCLRDPWPF